MEFFGRHHHHQPSGSATPDDKDYIPPPVDLVCPHTELIPHWDNAADLGKPDKVVAYRCDSCGQSFTPAEAQTLRADEAERVRALTELPEDETPAQDSATEP